MPTANAQANIDGFISPNPSFRSLRHCLYHLTAGRKQGYLRHPAATFAVTHITGGFAVSEHDGSIKGEAIGLAANPEDLPMLTRMTRFSRAPEFVLSLSFLGILAVYVAAASGLA